MVSCGLGCEDWSPRRILWVTWSLNCLVQTIWSLLAVVQGQRISKLSFEDGDATSENLVLGIVATSAWAVTLIGLFLFFSLFVLLRKVGYRSVFVWALGPSLQHACPCDTIDTTLPTGPDNTTGTLTRFLPRTFSLSKLFANNRIAHPSK